MAANPAISLAVQFAAAGVPMSGCRLRRNLATKPHKATIMAAKSNWPEVQLGGGILVSTPCQVLGRNMVNAKREKTIMAAYPVSVQFLTDVPEYTSCRLENNSGENLTLDDKTIWEGSRTVTPQKNITDGEVTEFKHEADGGSVLGSVGALQYLIGDGKGKWIIAWSNSKNEINKVYTQILEGDDVVDWNLIKESLEKSVHKHEATDESGYLSQVIIDQTSAKPMMKATLSKLLQDKAPAI